MIEIIGLEKENKWLDIVKQFNNHDVYYMPQYTKAFHSHGDGEPILFYHEGQNVAAINVVMKRDIADCGHFSQDVEKGTFFDIVTPYGYGGFLVEGGDDERAFRELNREYTACCKQYGIVSEFVRFHPLLKNHTQLEAIYDIVELGRTVSMDLTSPEIIYSNIRAKTRNRIRKAEANGVEVSWGNSMDLYAAFKELYDETMERNKAAQYYYFDQRFFESIKSDLRDNATVFYATYNGEIIAMQIVLCCNKRMYTHLQASKQEYRHLSPVALVNYQTALWACEHGFEQLYLGGGVGAAEDSLYRYKSNFNINSDCRFVTGRKIFDKQKYEYLLGIREKACKTQLDSAYFPAYRAGAASSEVE